MKTTIITGLAFGALTLAGCSSGSSTANFCEAYDAFDETTALESEAMTTISDALSGGDVTVAELNDAGAAYLGEVEDIAETLNDMKGAAKDSEVKDALALLAKDGLDPLREAAKVARDADDLATFSDDFFDAIGATSDEAAIDEASDTVDDYYSETCPAPSN